MKTGYKVGELMTQRPIVVRKNTDLVSTVKKMKDNNVGAILIINKEGLSGIVTQQDITYKVVGENRIAKETKVEEIMEPVNITISPDKDIFDALILMRDMNIRHLPVFEDNRFVGLLTMKDILKFQPQLFDLIIKTIELREENNKPVNKVFKDEGICNICGEYTKKLRYKNDIAYCENCFATMD